MIRPTRAHFRSYLLRTRKPAIPGRMSCCVLANYLHTIDPKATLGIYSWQLGRRHTPLPNWAHRVMNRFDRLDLNCTGKPVPARVYRKRVLEVL